MRERRDSTPSSEAIARWMLPSKSMRSGPSDHCQRAAAGGERIEHDPFERLIVLAEDEVAEAPAHLGLPRSELAPDLLHIGAAHGQLCLDLRIVCVRPHR